MKLTGKIFKLNREYIMRTKLYLLLILTSLFISGCGGGVVGTTGYQREYSPAETAVNVGWEEFSLGHYSNSIAEFNNVLTYTHSPAQAVEANVGLGWAHTKTTGIEKGYKYFEAAKDADNDAKVGLAGYYLSTAKKENMELGIELLSSFGLDNVDYVYTPKRDYGINNAKAHALMAAMFNYVGEIEKAKAHAKKASELNVAASEPPYSSVTQVIDWVNLRD